MYVLPRIYSALDDQHTCSSTFYAVVVNIYDFLYNLHHYMLLDDLKYKRPTPLFIFSNTNPIYILLEFLTKIPFLTSVLTWTLLKYCHDRILLRIAKAGKPRLMGGIKEAGERKGLELENSSFIIHRSSFIIHHSSLIIHHSFQSSVAPSVTHHSMTIQ